MIPLPSVPRLHFVTFATPAFRVRQRLLNLSARWFGEVDRLHVWTKERLAADGFPVRHAELFPNSIGFGWYAWKPYIILQALDEAEVDDLVIYQDVGRREPVAISRSLREWDGFLSQRGWPCVAGLRIPEWGANKLWTKSGVFKATKLDGPQYMDAAQVQASWSVWRKCPKTLAFVQEWASLCQRLELVGGQLENGVDGEMPGFHEHRWDQSLLTLLALREDMPVLDPSALHVSSLNGKSIDSFGKPSPTAKGFDSFMGLVRLYFLAEQAVKKIGLGRSRPHAR